MKTFLTLDVVGVALALVIGLLILFFGGVEGSYMLLVILVFLVASALVTRVGLKRKLAMNNYELVRGWKNVLANGIVPLVIAFIIFLNSNFGFISQRLLLVAYVAGVAAITADKFSSEIGIFDNAVIMLVSFKKVRPGKSGGISRLGVLSGVFGAFVIAISLFSFSNFSLLLVVVVVSGVFGDFVDSFFGYFEERAMGNKYTSNILCAVAGAALGFLLILF